MCRSSLSLALSVFVVAAVPAQTLVEPPVRLAEFVVTPSRFDVADAPTRVAPGLTAAELEVLPQLGDDLYRSIARLPGLAADDISARFWVRGAPNTQLLARLDGVDLIEPFHLKDVDGALSIVDPAAISRLELSTGGFGVEHGGRLAGVLTMETKSATRPATALSLSLTGIGARRQATFAGDRGRWFVAARRGYPDVALKVAGRDDDVTPRYYDVFAKIEYDLSAAHTVAFHALHAGDALTYLRTKELTSSYDSDYVWGRWRGSFGPDLSGEGVLSFARLTWERDGSGRLDNFPFSLRDHRQLEQATLRQDWTLVWSEQALLRSGFEARTGASRYDYALSHQRTGVVGGAQVVVSDNVNDALEPDGDALGVFGSAKFQPWRALVIEPGVRFDRHSYTRDSEVNPRLNAALTRYGMTLRAAWGLHSQAQGLQELAVADGERRFQRAERAEHRVLGLERRLGSAASLRVEAYERILTHPRPRWENLDNPYDLFPETQADREPLRPSRGRARGAEVLLSGTAAAAMQWHLSYVLSRTEEWMGGRWVPRSRDQRHAAYADITYTMNPRWQFSAAAHYHSGWPTTDVVYGLTTLNNGRRLLVSANGPIYGLRLPDYHRLDLRATRRFTVRRGELRLFIDVFNAYDRVNLLGYDHRVTVTGTTVTDVKKPREQLPLLPSIGLDWEF